MLDKVVGLTPAVGVAIEGDVVPNLRLSGCGPVFADEGGAHPSFGSLLISSGSVLEDSREDFGAKGLDSAHHD